MKEETRICKKCGKEKVVTEFQRIGIRDYRRRSCRDCIADYHHSLYFGDIKPINRGLSTRKCRRCGEIKPIDDFPKIKGKYSIHGWQKHSCKDCDNKDHAARESLRRKKLGEIYRQNNKRRNKKYLEARRLANKKAKIAVMEKYGGAYCKCCGETCLSMLTLDHINNDGSDHRKAIGGSSVNMYSYVKKNGYPNGFQVLCYNCNISKHRNGGICEHQLHGGSETIPSGSTLKRVEARTTLI